MFFNILRAGSKLKVILVPSAIAITTTSKYSFCERSVKAESLTNVDAGSAVSNVTLDISKPLNTQKVTPKLTSVVKEEVVVNQVHSQSPNNNDVAISEELNSEPDSWDIEKENCPFCKHFMQSPCAKQFKQWSICVDKCKTDDSDFVSVCQPFTTKLLDCTAQHVEYFKDL